MKNKEISKKYYNYRLADPEVLFEKKRERNPKLI